MRRLVCLPLAVALSTAACGSTVQIRSNGQQGGLSGDPAATAPGLVAGPGGTARPGQQGGGAAGPGGVVPGSAAGGTAPPATGGALTPSAPSGISRPVRGPLTGVGFDARTAHFGVEYVEGGDAFLSSAGFSSLSTGDARALVEVMVKDVNARGGVLGRRLVPAYHSTDAATGSSNPASTAQQACTDFTQDQRVFAAVVVSPAAQCLTQQRVHNSYVTTQIADDTSLRQNAPYGRLPLALSFSRLVPALLDRLQSSRFLTTGSKVGVLHPDTPVGRRVLADLTARLKSKGIAVTRSYAYNATSATASAGDVPNAVLPFRSGGVDRVIGTDASTAYFMIAAEQQRYRPRYALNSFMNLASVMESVPPKAQLEGSVGVGWLGPNDVSGTNLDVTPPGFASCKDYIRRSGQSATGFALIILTTYCDSLRLFLYAAERGEGLDAESLRRGLAAGGARFPSALVLDSAYSDTRMDGTSSVRDIAFDTGCQCFRYQSRQRRAV